MYRFAARRTGGRISIMLPIWRLVRGAMIGLLVVVVACSLPSDQRAAFAAVADATTRVSVTSEGTQSSYTCLEPTISSDGSCVVFRSFSSDLVAGDSNGEGDIFVHDRNTGVTSRVSVDSDGTQANNDCYEASISSDGRYVSYRSSASNLVAGDTNGALDIFVHDRSTGVTSRVSVDSDGTQANSDSYSPAISSDGRYVTYCSFASNLIVGDTNGAWDVFVHDRNTGVTSRVSVASDGTEGNSGSSYPFVSSDGRYVTYCSDASNLVVGDTNALVDIFVHDRSTGVTSRADVALDGTQSNGACYDPSISTDGRYVTYYSLASNLVTDDTNGTSDVFVRDRNTGVTSRVSASSDSAQGNDYCFTPSISPDGRYITFCTESSGLVAGDTNSTYDVFVHDRNTAVTTRASVTSDGSQANSESGSPSMSADGRYIAFYSEASNLVAGDTNASGDVFVHDRSADYTPVPVRGVDRYETAVVASQKNYAPGSTSTVLIASGTNWPDALGGGALSGALDAPILLVRPDELPESVSAEIARLGASKAIILGGRSAVSDATKNAIDDLPGMSTERIGGATRYETASELAERTKAELGAEFDGTVFLTTASNYPDALAASALAASNGWPILLTRAAALPESTSHALTRLEASRLLVIGGTSAVSDAVKAEAEVAVGLPAIRLDGANRFDTAVAIATYGVDSGGLEWNGLAIATGHGFPDALAAGCVQGKRGSVMLLTEVSALPAESSAALEDHQAEIHEVWFFGGTAAISDGVRNQVANILQ